MDFDKWWGSEGRLMENACYPHVLARAAWEAAEGQRKEAIKQLAEKWKQNGRDYRGVAAQCCCAVDRAKFESKATTFMYCASRLFDLLKD